ncbi:hypothetical protein TSUD_163510 [Trifolium subterraneum]|uniref:Uncharacterized protein n=1 Tax=Trifolium subterraneum TaxID=3900 RepID=A0A2Z6MZI6_TRISU|nr:hypothetical protein TSUD_163510 [Trifolium subterraneum]
MLVILVLSFDVNVRWNPPQMGFVKGPSRKCAGCYYQKRKNYMFLQFGRGSRIEMVSSVDQGPKSSKCYGGDGLRECSKLYFEKA